MRINHSICLLILICYSSLVFAKAPELVINQKEINNFIEIVKVIKKNYVYELDDEKLMIDAAKGILTKLDPHSTYYTKNEYLDIVNKTKGEYGGIGMEIAISNGSLQIVKIYDDSPASASGLKENDIIINLDNKPVSGMNINDVKNLVQGEINTSIKMTIYRPNTKKSFELEIERKILKIGNIESKALNNNVLYLKINYFSDATYNDIVSQINDYRHLNNGRLHGLILDFRDNGGGLLEQAVKISDAFLETGDIVSIKYRNQDDIRKYHASSNTIIANDIPMALLINNHSASASEIVTAALKDNKRALIVGNKSFGKGSVQNIIPLKDGSAIKVTTALFYTPNGLMIQNNGIEPDIEIDNGTFIKKIDNGILSENDLENASEEIISDYQENINNKTIDDLQLYVANQMINYKIQQKNNFS